MTSRSSDEGRAVRPFSSGSEGYDWLAANCERCTKRGEPDASGVGPCPMETAVSCGFILGTISQDIAAQIGATVRGEYADMPRQCSQFAPSMICESIKTRSRRPCGKPATATVTDLNDLTRAVCERHRKAYLAAMTPTAPAMEDDAETAGKIVDLMAALKASLAPPPPSAVPDALPPASQTPPPGER